MERFPSVDVKQSSIDALPHEMAIVDADGTIVAVNEAWRAFADRNHGVHPSDWVDENYFEICEQADDDLADRASRHIYLTPNRSVQKNIPDQFYSGYRPKYAFPSDI